MHWNDLVFHPGNEELQRFVELGILAARLEIPLHFHVEGMRGTGKTTLIRAARGRLPGIARIAGCLYNCRPDSPHCPQHRFGAETAGTETVPMPFLEISHSAKVGTVAGSIDLARLTAPDNPSAAVLPGTLPRSHRGIVFVDEINRLADTSPALVDVLLDAMGTKPGRVQIEEIGLPAVEIPLLAGVWAASNPDEEPGPLQEIRKQLADRFDFCVRIERPVHPDTVRSIIKAGNGGAVNRLQRPPQHFLNLEALRLDSRVEEFLGEIYVRFNLESIRGIQAARLGAMLHAAWQGREKAGFQDLVAVLPAALRHRLEPQKMPEVLAVLNNVAGELRREAARPAVKDSHGREPVENRRYPALWRGLFKRMAGLAAKSDGQKSEAANAVNQPRQALEEEEKKKRAAEAVLAGKGGVDR